MPGDKIVDADLQTLEVFTLGVQGYACTARYGACDEIVVSHFPSLKISLSEVFGGT